MVTELKQVGIGDKHATDVGLVFFAVLVAFTLISVLIFSCAEGASRDKTSAAEPGIYGGGCTAGCGAGCGGGCGG